MLRKVKYNAFRYNFFILKNMEKITKEKLIMPITVILACLIFGGSFYLAQINKQKFIERQEALKLENETKKAQQEKQNRQSCFNEASDHAKEIAKTKARLYPANTTYKIASENDMYLNDDFNKYYSDCLSKNGLQK